MTERHSPCCHPLDAGFLAERLADTRSCDRIAGCFRAVAGSPAAPAAVPA